MDNTLLEALEGWVLIQSMIALLAIGQGNNNEIPRRSKTRTTSRNNQRSRFSNSGRIRRPIRIEGMGGKTIQNEERSDQRNTESLARN